MEWKVRVNPAKSCILCHQQAPVIICKISVLCKLNLQLPHTYILYGTFSQNCFSGCHFLVRMHLKAFGVWWGPCQYRQCQWVFLLCLLESLSIERGKGRHIVIFPRPKFCLNSSLLLFLYQCSAVWEQPIASFNHCHVGVGSERYWPSARSNQSNMEVTWDLNSLLLQINSGMKSVGMGRLRFSTTLWATSFLCTLF